MERLLNFLFGLGLAAIAAGLFVYFGYIRPDPEGLLLKDYAPRPVLKVATTEVKGAKFPVFDAHIHLEYSGMSAADVLETMERANVYKVVSLETHGLYGEKLENHISRYESKAPEKFLTVCNLDYSNIDADDYPERAVQSLEASYAAGARALKIWRDLGLQIRDGKRQLLRLDDPRFDAVLRRAGELKMPVIMHNADPTAFWRPVDGRNERYEELQARLTDRITPWGKYGPLFESLTGRFFKVSLMRHPYRLHYDSRFNWMGTYFPAKDEILSARANVLAKHPNTLFIGAHMGYSADNLAWLAEELDRFPNYYAELSHVVPELGRQPFTTRDFFIKYQDRILFGLDGKTEMDAYAASFRFLETRDEYFDYPRSHWNLFGRWKIYGIGLPDPVLQKIYSKNAEKVFSYNP